MEATKFKSRREHRKDVHRFNRYIKGETWDTEISTLEKHHLAQSYFPHLPFPLQANFA
jgi:hypothetical protein